MAVDGKNLQRVSILKFSIYPHFVFLCVFVSLWFNFVGGWQMADGREEHSKKGHSTFNLQPSTFNIPCSLFIIPYSLFFLRPVLFITVCHTGFTSEERLSTTAPVINSNRKRLLRAAIQPMPV